MINLPADLTKYSIDELEKMLCQITSESKSLVEELSKRYQIKNQENLKKAS